MALFLTFGYRFLGALAFPPVQPEGPAWHVKISNKKLYLNVQMCYNTSNLFKLQAENIVLG